MTRKTAWFSCWILTFFLLVALPGAAQSPIERFERQVQRFTQQLRTTGIELSLERIVQREVIIEPQQQAVEIMEAARLLTESEGRVQLRTLQELDIPSEVRKVIAADLVERGLIQRGDLLAEVNWSLGEKRFQTLAAVYPEDWCSRWRRRISQLANRIRAAVCDPKEDIPSSFEPLLFFTPVWTEESRPIPASSGDRSGSVLRSIQQPWAPVAFTSTLASSPILAREAEATKLWKPEAEPVRIPNGYQFTCVILNWHLELRTDGCRIFNPKPYTRVLPEWISPFCLFWGVEHSINEGLPYPAPYDKCPRDPKSGMQQEECLNSALRAVAVLRFPGVRPVRLAGSRTSTVDVCCSRSR